MNNDELLSALAGKLQADPRLVAPCWARLVVVGNVEDSSESMHGFRIDTHGKAHPVAPSDIQIFALLRALRDAMAASDHKGRPWLTCLLAVTASGAIEGQFEYSDAHRWRITPDNFIARSREIVSWGAK